MMQIEAETKVGAKKGEHSKKRQTYFSGTRVRRMDTRLGTLYLLIPKLRKGGYIPFFITERRRLEQALIALIQEAFINGVSTRKIERLARSLGTDFTYLKVIQWEWYYLSTVLDDYSRYIIAWRLCQTMIAEYVKRNLDIAITKTGVKHVHVYQRPRLLSDNRSCFIAAKLKKYLQDHKIRHIRSKIYHPMTQGKIVRYFRSLKNLILLNLYYSPTELEVRIGEWVEYYTNHRYHEAIDNVTPSDKYFGRDREILKKRKKIKTKTMKKRRRLNQTMALLES